MDRRGAHQKGEGGALDHTGGSILRDGGGHPVM